MWNLRRFGAKITGLSGAQVTRLIARWMKHRHIAVVADENFHGPHVCLVAAEPSSNFLLVEQYAQRALALADRVVVLERGTVAYDGDPAGVGDPEALVRSYLAAPT